MTSDRQLARLLDTWFAEGPVTVPDRVLDDVAERIAHRTQRPAWRLRSQRFTSMSTPARLALVAAALGLALLAGGILLVGARDSNPPDGPLPATVSPDIPAAPPLPEGVLLPGDYAVRPGNATDLMFVTTVPDGTWIGAGGQAIQGPIGPDAPAGLALLYVLNPSVRDDPCRPFDDQAEPVATPDVEALVADFARLDGATVSGVTSLVLDGYPGTRLDLQLPATLPCDHYFPLSEPNGFYAQGPANRWRIWLLDVGGGREVAMLALSDYAGTPSDDRAAAEAMIETVQIGRPLTMENGPMAPGTYGASLDDVDFASWSFSVPAGWSGIRDWAVYPTKLGFGSNRTGAADGLGVVYAGAAQVVLDACGATGATSQAGSVDELVAAIRAKADWIASTPVDDTLGGIPARRLDVDLPPDLDGCDGRYHVFMETGTEHGFYAQGPANKLRIWVLDLDGRPVIFLREWFASSPAKELDEADRIIASFVIKP